MHKHGVKTFVARTEPSFLPKFPHYKQTMISVVMYMVGIKGSNTVARCTVLICDNMALNC